MKTTIVNLNGENERISLPDPCYSAKASGQEDMGAGVWLTGLYRGPRTGRMIAETHSIWESGNSGRTVGTRFREVDTDEWLRLCGVAGIDPQVEAVEI